MRRVWRDDHGERHWIRGETEQEIADKIAELKFSIKMGQDQIDSKMTVAAWARNWLSTYIQPKIREPGEPKKRGTMTPKSGDMYFQKTNNYIIPAIGHYRLCDIKDIHLQKLLNSQRGLSDSHVKKLKIVLSAMFSQAFNSRLIPFNPAAGLELPAADCGQRRSLTDYERSVILKVAKTHRDGLWVRFLLETGVRPGESAPLRIYDLVFDDPQPRVKIYKDIESGTDDLVSEPKTKAGFREIPLPRSLIPDLKKAIKGRPKDDFVFPFKDGTMLTETRMSNNWQSFIRQVDLEMGAETTPNGHIYDPKDLLKNGKPKYPDPNDKTKPRNGHKVSPDLTPYCLRHTYCTDLQRKGVPLNVAKYFMGHSNISTTAGIYTHNGESEILLGGSLIDGSPKHFEVKEKDAVD